MNKEEILRKSRAEGNDEGIQHAMKIGSAGALMGMVFLYFALHMLTLFLNEDKTELLRSASILFYAGIGLQQLIYGIKARKKVVLIVGILLLMLSIVSIILYIKRLVG